MKSKIKQLQLIQQMLIDQTATTETAALSPAITSPNNNQGSKDLLRSSNKSSPRLLSNMANGRENSIRSASSPSPSSSSPSSPSSTHSSSTASSSTSTTYTKPSLTAISPNTEMPITNDQRTPATVDSNSNSTANSKIANQDKQTLLLDDVAKTRRASLEQFQGISGVSWKKLNIASWLKDDVMFNKLNSAINLRLQQQKQENLRKENKQQPENKIESQEANYSTLSNKENGKDFSKKNLSVQASYLPTLEKQYCKDYACCGLLLPSLHDLLDHYEDVHTTSSLSRPLPNYNNFHLNNAHSTITSLRSNYEGNKVTNYSKKRSSSSVETPDVKAFALKEKLLNTATKKSKLNRASSTPGSSHTEHEFAKPILSSTGKNFSLSNKNAKISQQSCQPENLKSSHDTPDHKHEKPSFTENGSTSSISKNKQSLVHEQAALKGNLGNNDFSKMQSNTLANKDGVLGTNAKDVGKNTKDTNFNISGLRGEEKKVQSKQKTQDGESDTENTKHQTQNDKDSDRSKYLVNDAYEETKESNNNHNASHNGSNSNSAVSRANSDMTKMAMSTTEDEKILVNTSQLHLDHPHHAHIFKRPSSVSPLTVSEKAKDSLLHDINADKHAGFHTAEANYESEITSMSNPESATSSFHGNYGDHAKIAHENILSLNGITSEDRSHVKSISDRTLDVAPATIYMKTVSPLARAASISMPIASTTNKDTKAGLDTKSIPGTPKHRSSVVSMASPASVPVVRTTSLAFPSKTSLLKKSHDESLQEFASSTLPGMTKPASALKIRAGADHDELVRAHSQQRSRTSSITSSMRSIHSDDEDFAKYTSPQTHQFQNNFSESSDAPDVSKSFININELVGNRGFANEQARRLYLMELEENKPFKCPVIGCGKMYKNQNGLKYHRAHGHQGQKLYENADGTFSIIDPASNQPYPDGMEFETDKPYRCDVCAKRYKNLNGLKYHRAHSTH
mgnify:FL=1